MALALVRESHDIVMASICGRFRPLRLNSVPCLRFARCHPIEMSDRLRPGIAGFSLVELVFTLVIFGILISIAAPAMGGWMKRMQMRAALSQFTQDIFYTRMLAVREGRSVSLKLTPSDCATSYQIRVLPLPSTGASPRVAKTVDLNDEARGLCITVPGGSGTPKDSVVFNSRGIQTGASGERAYSVQYNGMVDSVVVTVAGLVKRTS